MNALVKARTRTTSEPNHSLSQKAHRKASKEMYTGHSEYNGRVQYRDFEKVTQNKKVIKNFHSQVLL